MRLFHNNKSVLSRFLISYLVVLVLPIIFNLFLHLYTIKTVKDEAYYINSSVLEQNMKIMDRYISEIDNLAMSIMVDPEVKKLLLIDNPTDSAVVYNLFEAQKQFTSLKLNEITKNAFIYCQSIDSIISLNNIYTSSKQFYKNYLNYSDMDYDSWYHDILLSNDNRRIIPSTSVSIDNEKQNLITYVYALPAMRSKSFRGSVTILLDEEIIRNNLSNVSLKGGWFCILDENNNDVLFFSDEVLTMLLDDYELNDKTGSFQYNASGEKMVINYVTSNYNGWKYISASPVNLVIEKAQKITQFAWVVFLLILFCGILFSTAFAYKNSKPLLDLLALINRHFNNPAPAENEYETIHSGITALADSNEEFRATLEKQTLLLKETFFSRLIRGSFADDKTLAEMMNHHQVSFKKGEFSVLLFQLNTYYLSPPEILATIGNKRITVKHELEGTVSPNSYIHDVDDYIIMLLLFRENYKKSFHEEISSLISNIQNGLAEKYNEQVNITVGNIYEKHTDIFKSFSEAMQVIDYNSIKGSNIVFYGQLPESDLTYYFPIEIENRIISLVKSGNKHECQTLLSELFGENISKRTLPFHILKRFIYQLQGTAIRLNSYISKENDGTYHFTDKIDTLEDFDKASLDIINVFGEICDNVLRQRDENSELLIHRIIEYINDFYADPDLYLVSVAKHFALSEAYMSHFFKNKTGETFSAYLEKLRIYHAENFLATNKYTINEIAKMVGYNSDQTFRRAFKRLKGISPSNFRG